MNIYHKGEFKIYNAIKIKPKIETFDPNPTSHKIVLFTPNSRIQLCYVQSYSMLDTV